MSQYLTADAVAKMQETLDFITRFPDRHYQGDWIRLESEEAPHGPVKLNPKKAASCGTAGCFAGWATLFNNAVPEFAWHEESRWNPVQGKYTKFWEVNFDRFNVEEETIRLFGGRWHDQDWEWYNPGPYAVYIREQLETMFQGENTVEELWFLGQQLAQGRLNIPPNVVPVDPSVRESGDDW